MRNSLPRVARYAFRKSAWMVETCAPIILPCSTAASLAIDASDVACPSGLMRSPYIGNLAIDLGTSNVAGDET